MIARNSTLCSRVLALIILGGAVSAAALAAPLTAITSESSAPLVLHNALVLPRVGRAGRSAVHSDPVEAQIVAGLWRPPAAGEIVEAAGGPARTWKPLSAGADGWLESSDLAGGYADFQVDSPARRVALLKAAGHTLVYVNGDPRAGDPYAYGYVWLPVVLRAGANDLLFQVGRGRLRVEITFPTSAALIETADATLPDLPAARGIKTRGAIVIVNATEQPMTGLSVSAACGRTVITPLPDLPPLSVRKPGFAINAPARPPGNCPVDLKLRQRVGRSSRTLSQAAVTLRVRQPGETYKETFLSDIDGSVQYFAVNPMHRIAGDRTRPALFLSLHGAGVEAIGQADAYEYKTWGDIVCPTNRRPYGFDWEDWGRLDAFEVLTRARAQLNSDPARIYLTGHSMGGHGTWQIGANYPSLFAAIGPSAGWISFATYAGGRPNLSSSPAEEILQRANSSSDTLSLVPNFGSLPVYILHGGADDNVPVEQARTMAKLLGDMHADFEYHEQPGAGHWWDASPEPGADCVDWAPMFDFFGRHALPVEGSVRQVDFVTGSPGVSAVSHWATVDAQLHQGQLSSIHLRYDPGLRRFSGTSGNVLRLALNVNHFPPGSDLSFALDGQTLEHIPWPAAGEPLFLEQTNSHWSVVAAFPTGEKGPARYGGFKSAFNHRAVLVYGTKGTPEENAWAYARARYDSETFWYRGNGSFDLIPDTAYNASVDPDRSVILYGREDTNAAWKLLLDGSPVVVSHGAVQVGSKTFHGEDLACFFIRPRRGSAVASVAAVSGSGLVGMRLTDRIPYFVSGTALPDCLVLGSDMLAKGAGGIRAAGFFGIDWTVEHGDFAWSP